MSFSDPCIHAPKTKDDDTLISELEARIGAFETLMFDRDDLLRKEQLERLQRLYKTYESLRREYLHTDIRPSFQIQVTTYNSPAALRRLLLSVRDELLYFAFPAAKITLIIIDDSDCPTALEKNKYSAGDMFPWPFKVFYYGPHEQKMLLTEYSASSTPSFEDLLARLSKNIADFTSADQTKWGKKGVCGAMNMAFIVSGKHVSEATWTIALTDTASLGTYVKVSGESFEHHHPFSYFHRAARVLDHAAAKKARPDLILAASVGDYRAAQQRPKVLDKFIGPVLTTHEEYLLAACSCSCIENVQDLDLSGRNEPYRHRFLELEALELHSPSKNSLESLCHDIRPGHMLFSPRLVQTLPYVYSGPGHSADKRFILRLQNDPRFHVFSERSLCLSKTNPK
jgi:hypothetical protein